MSLWISSFFVSWNRTISWILIALVIVLYHKCSIKLGQIRTNGWSLYRATWYNQKYCYTSLGVIHMWRPLWEWVGGEVRQIWDNIVRRGRGCGIIDCSGRPIFIFLLKKIGFASRPSIMLSQILIYYWQEIFLLTLIWDSEAIF